MCNRTLQIYLIRVPFGYLLDVWTVYDGERLALQSFAGKQSSKSPATTLNK